MSDRPDRIDCPLCGHTRFETIRSVAQANFVAAIPSFAVRRCLNCGLGHMAPWPTPEDLQSLYVEEGVFSTPKPAAARRDSALIRTLERLYRHYGSDGRFVVRTCLRLANCAQTPRILDVGCSTGRLLDSFLDYGGKVDLTGLDIDPNARTRAPKHLQSAIKIEDFLAHRTGALYDIVSLKFIVEHLLDANAYVAKAVSLLRPGGVLFVATPDIDSPMAKAQDADWNSLNDPKLKVGHIVWFNRHALARMAERHGLKLSLCTNRGPVFHHLSRPLQSAIVALLGNDPVSGRIIRSRALRLVWAAFLDGLLSERFDYGDSLYAFMAKPE